MAKESKSAIIKRLNCKTQLQWNNLNRCIIDMSDCIDYFNHTYYAESNTREMTSAEIENFKNKRKSEQDKRKNDKQEWDNYINKKYEEAEKYSTAVQWLKDGRVVKQDAVALNGSYFHIKRGNDQYGMGKSSDYYYYNIDDTIEDAAQAAELLKSFPNNDYDGRIWW